MRDLALEIRAHWPYLKVFQIMNDNHKRKGHSSNFPDFNSICQFVASDWNILKIDNFCLCDIKSGRNVMTNTHASTFRSLQYQREREEFVLKWKNVVENLLNYFYDIFDTNFHCWVSKALLHLSAVIPLSCTHIESRQTFSFVCWISPPSLIIHRWFSDSSQYFITTIDPFVKLTSVRHKSTCFIWPFFEKTHSWLPPVSWHWYIPDRNNGEIKINLLEAII